MMKGELWRYSRRELNNVLSVSGDEQFRATILMYGYMAACMCVERWIWAKALEELLVMRGIDQGAEQHAAAATADPFDLLMVMMVIPMVGSG